MLLNNKELNYSFSQFRLYNECPKKYQFKYARGIQEPTNENLLIGSIIHEILETAKDMEGQDYKDAIQRLRDLYGYFYPNKLEDEVKELIKDKDILAQELKLFLDDFIGIIDLVYKVTDKPYNYVIADYKVTKKPKTQESIYSEGQLLIYKYIYCKINNLDPSKVAAQYINIAPFLKEKLIAPIEPYNPDISECESVWEKANEAKQKILYGEFPKKKTWCKWCFYREECNNEP